MSAHRKPVHLERKGGKSPRQRIWEALRALALTPSPHPGGEGEEQHAQSLPMGRFDLDRIERATRIEPATIFSYLRSLQKAGFIAVVEPATAQRKQVYALARDNGCEAPRIDKQGRPVTQGMGNEQMWRTLRLIGEFGALELAAHASTERVPVLAQTAERYLGHLYRAGYLVLVCPARKLGSGGYQPARYRLAPGKYSGPRPPMIQRSKAVYDPNLDQVVWEEVQRDDDY